MNTNFHNLCLAICIIMSMIVGVPLMLMYMGWMPR